jgi:hypothetical protein
MTKSYQQAKLTKQRIIESGNLNKKGKLLYFVSRNGKLLDTIPYDLYNLNENLSFDLTQEFFTIREVSLITNNKPQFFVFRGFNFSTRIEYDKNKKAFIEKQYDLDYMKSCRMSQYESKIFGKKFRFVFDDLIKLIFGIGSVVLFFIMFWTGILLIPT